MPAKPWCSAREKGRFLIADFGTKLLTCTLDEGHDGDHLAPCDVKWTEAAVQKAIENWIK